MANHQHPELSFEYLVEQAPFGTITIDASSRVIYANAAVERILGHPPDELVGSPLTRIIPDSLQSRHFESFRSYQKTGERNLDWDYVELPAEHADGHELPVAITFREAVLDGDPVYTGLFYDISEQRRQRETLENREQVLRELYDVIADRERGFTEQVEGLLRLGREELGVDYGTLSEVRDDDYIFEVVDAADDSIQSGDVVPVTATYCEVTVSTERTLVSEDVAAEAPELADRAGHTEWGVACYLGAPVFVEGEVCGTFCFYDFEPREDPFSQWHETLVDLMSRWVGYELERRQANERLQRQNAQLERFASIVSHDLRNPLNVAQGRLQMAREDPGGDHLAVVAQSLERMETLVDDVLELARAGATIDERTPLSLATAVEQSWRSVETGDATLQIRTEATVYADQSRLRQLLENLVRNAVEHGARPASGRSAPGDSVEHGGANVTVTVGDLEDGFYLADDGVGIPADIADEVFESGYSTTADGTGFGLSIVEEIATAHGWEVAVTESADGGARFEITGVTLD